MCAEEERRSKSCEDRRRLLRRNLQDISANKSIRDAHIHENFFRSRPVYHNFSNRCGLPQLAKKLNTSGQGALLLGIITKYSVDYQAIVDGKYEELSTTELSGQARIHYILQAIFVRSLEVHDWPFNVGIRRLNI